MKIKKKLFSFYELSPLQIWNLKVCNHDRNHNRICFYDDTLTELVNHYANRTLIVSCTKDYTKF